MNVLKRYQFWITIIFGGVLFTGLYPISVSLYTNAWYVLIFNLISTVLFSTILYKTLIKSWKESEYGTYISLLVISSLPHLVLSFLSYGSWACLALGILMILILMILKRKM